MRRVPLTALLAVLLTLSGIALAARPASREQPDAVRVENRAGVFGQENSREGLPVLTVSRLLPGQSQTGTVTIRNTGDETQAFSLLQSSPADTPGDGGASLSAHLRLTVDDLTTGTRVYDGTLAGLSTAAAGDLDAGSARTYRFTAALPADAPGADLAGATSSVDYQWQAEDATTGGTGTPTTPATPPSTRTPEQPAPGTTTPPSGTTPARPAADRRAPGLLVRSAARGRLSKSNRFKVSVLCDERCRLTLRGRLSIKRVKRTYALRTTTVSLNARRRSTVTYKLSRTLARRVRSALRRRRAVTVRIQMTGRDRAGNVTRRSYRTRIHR